MSPAEKSSPCLVAEQCSIISLMSRELLNPSSGIAASDVATCSAMEMISSRETAPQGVAAADLMSEMRFAAVFVVVLVVFITVKVFCVLKYCCPVKL